MVNNQNNTKKVKFFRGTRSVLGDNSEKKYKKAQWQRLFKSYEVTAYGTERMTGGQSRI